MLSYQHSYHAGHPADVLKHALLAALLERLTLKPAPLSYYESHAGRGIYPLREVHVATAQAKTQAFAEGLARIQPLLAQAPAALAPYRQALLPYLSDDVYQEKKIPGSPAIARALLRPHDTLDLCERHPQEVAALRQFVKGDTQIRVHAGDAHTLLPALIAKQPPARGVILIDPAYELKEEYADLCRTIAALYRTAPKLVTLLWYPLLSAGRHQIMVKNLAVLGIPATWRAEVTWADPADTSPEFKGAYGTGLLFLNLPYQLEDTLTEALDWLASRLAYPGFTPQVAVGWA